MQTTGLDFISAVKALKEGKCEGITTKHIPILKPYENFGELSGVDIGRIHFDHLLATDWMLVNPVVPTERVKVRRRICPVCETMYDDGNVCPCETVQLVDVVCHYDRPVKQPVVRRVELGPMSFNASKMMERTFPRPDEIADKTGHLIFEYTE